MFSHLSQLGSSIKARRSELGLSQAQLARMSGLTRQTISGLENGTINDLGFNRVCQVLNVLGLIPEVAPSGLRRNRQALEMAAGTASVSYREELTSDQLARVMATGAVPKKLLAPVVSLLDEAPISLLVMAVREAADVEHVAPKVIWNNLQALALSLGVSRQDIFS